MHIKHEEGGAAAEPEFTPSPDWLREIPEEDLTTSSNQIQPCTEEVGPDNKPEVLSVKQEVVEGHMMLEAAVQTEISGQQEGW